MSNSEPSEEQITELAHQIWEQEGKPEGKAEEHWKRAKEQLQNDAVGDVSDADSHG